jgi:hypothetical protein
MEIEVGRLVVSSNKEEVKSQNRGSQLAVYEGCVIRGVEDFW